MGEDKLRKLPVSFEQFYYENYPKVLRYLSRHLQYSPDAEDMTQEVFLYCYKSYDSFDESKSSLTSWLYLVTNSRLKNYYRDRGRMDETELLEELLPLGGDDTTDAALLEDIRRAVAAALAKLPDPQRQVVILKYFRNMRHGEIAEALGISEASSRVQLSRALGKLNGLLKNYQ